jgi:hypothetical protein
MKGAKGQTVPVMEDVSVTAAKLLVRQVVDRVSSLCLYSIYSK